MNLTGEIFFPGDKSISHRSLMFAALCNGKSKISNLSTGKDVQSTKNCLIDCGIKIYNEKSSYIVEGGKFINPKKELDCGNSGTTVRLLAGLLSGQNINATFVGDESLSNRPMKRIIEPLKLMGLNCSSKNFTLPLKIKSSKLNGINYKSQIASAQVKSAVLLAALGSNKPTSFIEPVLSRNHTEIMLKALGVPINTEKLKTTISKITKQLKPFNFNIPGDPSSAAFFAGAASMVKNSNLVLKNISGNDTRLGIFSILKQMGVTVLKSNKKNILGEKIIDIRIKNKRLNGIKINENQIPSIIDEIPIIAIIASQAKGQTKITGAKELRYKESDRISSIVLNLKKMGADITELEDGMIINGPKKLKGTFIKTYHDHRIAMAFKIASIIADGENQLDSIDCVDISYPEFFETLTKIT
ncbi:MAG: 3-phosphoshikimate 1-carboxyvinyltransferase [Candidatus Marinimicrobia bacterium]|nr:3-phosphoshikimate 1-carboxyvinyltransferase [Candidatus Neomarinimicrobiota bacterium]